VELSFYPLNSLSEFGRENYLVTMAWGVSLFSLGAAEGLGANALWSHSLRRLGHTCHWLLLITCYSVLPCDALYPAMMQHETLTRCQPCALGLLSLQNPESNKLLSFISRLIPGFVSETENRQDTVLVSVSLLW
jgi:hypothetical protein